MKDKDFIVVATNAALHAYVAEFDKLATDGHDTVKDLVPLTRGTRRLLAAVLAMAMQRADDVGQVGSTYTAEDAYPEPDKPPVQAVWRMLDAVEDILDWDS